MKLFEEFFTIFPQILLFSIPGVIVIFYGKNRNPWHDTGRVEAICHRNGRKAIPWESTLSSDISETERLSGIND